MIHQLTQSKHFIVGVGLFLVIVSAFAVVYEVYGYRQTYRDLNAVMNEKDELNAEWGRLLIEKQTFGASAQIGTRAVEQLGMVSPSAAQIIVLSKPQK